MEIVGKIRATGNIDLNGALFKTCLEEEAISRNSTFELNLHEFFLTSNQVEYLGKAMLKLSKERKKEERKQFAKEQRDQAMIAVIIVEKEGVKENTRQFKTIQKSLQGNGGRQIRVNTEGKIEIHTVTVKATSDVQDNVKRNYKVHGFSRITVMSDGVQVSDEILGSSPTKNLTTSPPESSPPMEANNGANLSSMMAPTETTSSTMEPSSSASSSATSAISTTITPESSSTTSRFSAPTMVSAEAHPSTSTFMATAPTINKINKTRVSIKRKRKCTLRNTRGNKRSRTSIPDGISTRAKRKLTHDETDSQPKIKRKRQNTNQNLTPIQSPPKSTTETPLPVLDKNTPARDSDSEDDRLVMDLNSEDENEEKMYSLAQAIADELEGSHLLRERPVIEGEAIEKLREKVDSMQEEVNKLQGKKKER